MLIESCLKNTEIYDLIEKLPQESIQVVKPKYLDGSQIIQVFVELSEVVVPSAISAISAYLVATRNSPTIKIKFNEKSKIEIEIQGKLRDKRLQENQLYKECIKLINEQIKEKPNNENDN